MKNRHSDNGWMGDHGKYGHNIENSKRRQALPAWPAGRPLPSFAGDAKFFDRLLSVRKMHEFIFITKAVAKNR